MSLNRLCVALLVACASMAHAAPAVYLTIDHSTEALMDTATAAAMWKKNLPLALTRLYPVGKWGFASEVEGGFDDGKVCVVTARALLLPRSGKNLLFKPAKMATAFGSQAGATPDQCQALAQAKLGEAMASIRAALSAR
jgi:hypothetical protein